MSSIHGALVADVRENLLAQDLSALATSGSRMRTSSRAEFAQPPQPATPWTYIWAFLLAPWTLLAGLVMTAVNNVVGLYRQLVREAKLLRRLTIRLLSILALTSRWIFMLARLLLFTFCLFPNWLYMLYVYLLSGRVIRGVRYGQHARNFVDIYLPHDIALIHKRQPIVAPPAVILARVKHFAGQFSRLADAFSILPSTKTTSAKTSDVATSTSILKQAEPKQVSQSRLAAADNMAFSAFKAPPSTPVANSASASTSRTTSTTSHATPTPPTTSTHVLSPSDSTLRMRVARCLGLTQSEIESQINRPTTRPGRPVVVFVTGGAWTIGFRMWGSLLGYALTNPIRSLFKAKSCTNQSHNLRQEAQTAGTCSLTPSKARSVMLWLVYFWQSPFASPLRCLMLVIATAVTSLLLWVLRLPLRIFEYFVPPRVEDESHPYLQSSGGLTLSNAFSYIRASFFSGWFDLDHLFTTLASNIPLINRPGGSSVRSEPTDECHRTAESRWRNPHDAVRDGAIAMCVDYRNFPQGTACDMVSDVCSAITWALNAASAYGGDPDQVYILGQSAGAHLILLAALECARNIATDIESGLCSTAGIPSARVEAVASPVGTSKPANNGLSGVSDGTPRLLPSQPSQCQTPVKSSVGTQGLGKFGPTNISYSQTPTNQARTLPLQKRFAEELKRMNPSQGIPEESTAQGCAPATLQVQPNHTGSHRRRALSSGPAPALRYPPQLSSPSSSSSTSNPPSTVVFDSVRIEERFRALPSSWVLRIRGLIALSGPCDLVRAERVFAGRGLEPTLLHAIMNVPSSDDLSILSPVHICRELLNIKKQRALSQTNTVSTVPEVALPLPPIWLLHGTADKTCDLLGSFELGALLNELGHAAWVDIFHGATHTDLLLEYPALGLELLSLHTHNIIRDVISDQLGYTSAATPQNSTLIKQLQCRPRSGSSEAEPILSILSGPEAIKGFSHEAKPDPDHSMNVTVPPYSSVLVVPSPLDADHAPISDPDLSDEEGLIERAKLSPRLLRMSRSVHNETQRPPRRRPAMVLRSPSLSNVFAAASSRRTDMPSEHDLSRVSQVIKSKFVPSHDQAQETKQAKSAISSLAQLVIPDESVSPHKRVLALWPWTRAGAQALQDYAALLRVRGLCATTIARQGESSPGQIESEETKAQDAASTVLEANFVRHIDTVVAARTLAQTRWPLISRRLVRLARIINPF